MQTDDIAVRIKPPGRPWQRYDADPESPVLTANAYGSDQASITLRRDLRIPWADLAAFTPVEIDVAGVPVWSGRLKDTPGRDYDATLNAEGWQYALDDVPIRRLYVHSRLGDWKDGRSFLDANLAGKGTAAGQVQTDSGITLGWPAGVTIGDADAYGASPAVGVILDLGPGQLAKRVQIDYQKVSATVTAGRFGWRVKVLSTANLSAAGSDAEALDITALAASGTRDLTIGTPARYVFIGLHHTYPTADAVYSEDQQIKLTGIRVFGETTYATGSGSALTADDVIRDAVTVGATQLSTDFTQITADSFVIPTLGLPSFQTPRELIEGVNALRNYVIRVGVDRRVVWKPRPTAPLFHVGAWSDYEFEDASLNNGAEIYDQVAVTGTAADGTPAVYENTQTVPLLDMTGTTRKKIVTVDAPLDSTVGDRIGLTFLETHSSSSLNGSIALAGAAAIRDAGGSSVHPSLLLRASQELVRLDDRTDPDTGGIGRNGMIATVEYRHGDRAATVNLDNTRRSWDATLARYNLVAGAATGA